MIARLRDAGRRRWLDLLLGLIALAIAAPSLAYPLGRDHGLALSVARAWRDGRVPYKLAWGQDPPGLYLLYGAQSALFGGGLHAIRLAELVLAPLLGLLCARLALRTARFDARVEQQPGPDGLQGLAMLTVSVVYYGFFGFWDTGRGELFVVTALFASLLIVVEVPPFVGERNAVPWRGYLRPLLAGLLAGAVATVVPSMVIFALVPIAFLAQPSRLHRGRALGVFTLGACAPAALLILLLASKGALSDAYDLLYDARCLYRPRLTLDFALERSLKSYLLMKPVSASVMSALALGAAFWTWRRLPARRHGYLLALVLVACVCASVVMRKKFEFAHWALIAGPWTLGVSLVALDVLSWVTAKRRALLLIAAHVLLAFALSNESGNWLATSQTIASRAMGMATRKEVDAAFRMDSLGFAEAERSEVGRWLHNNTSAADDVAIRGFEPDLYALADRTYRGRFFFTDPLTTTVCQYRRGEWLAQHDDEIARVRPRWVVALARTHTGPESAEHYAERGYTERTRIGGFAILERQDRR